MDQYISQISHSRDYTDVIVGVSEHDRGGFLVEQGYFTALEEYFMKTHVLKREYENVDAEDVDTSVDLENPYSGMQTTIFDMLADVERLCVWQTEDDLIECAEALP